MDGLLRWRPSIHMPRWASRINLEITGVRVERLQDISRLDIAAEGWPYNEDQAMRIELAKALNDDEQIDDAAIEWFATLWESINGKGSWEQNPFVWAISFRHLTPNA